MHARVAKEEVWFKKTSQFGFGPKSFAFDSNPIPTYRTKLLLNNTLWVNIFTL